MSVAKLTSEYKKFLGPTPNNAFSARCYASQFLHDPAKGWSHTPDEIALATNQPNEVISTFCEQWPIAAAMSADDLLLHTGRFERDSFVEAFFRNRLANETVLVDHILHVHLRVIEWTDLAATVLSELRELTAVPRSMRRRGRLPFWITDSYLGETDTDLSRAEPRFCRVEVIDKVEAAYPSLGSDPQWLLTKAKRLTRARLTGKQHQIMQLAVFSRSDDERRWATSYMNLVNYFEAAP